MKVCYWGTFERDYPRNAVLIAGLRQNGIEVIECHYALWQDGFRFNKLALLAGVGRKIRLAGRALLNYPLLIARYIGLADHDAVIVGYLGHLDIFLISPFAKLKGKPVIFDAFFSLYDAAILDWQLASTNSFLARLCRLVDRWACRLATLVLVDTKAQQEFFCREFGLPKEKVCWLYVGADDALFAPSADLPRARPFRVLYVGNYVPLHGVPVIMEAAQLLRKEEIEFWLVGENHRAASLAESRQDSHAGSVKIYPWMPPRQLRDKISEAAVCLGIFGTSDKAKRVIPGKAFLALAMGKALVTGDSPAARELLEDGKTAVLCEIGSAAALADAIRRLRQDALLRQRIGDEGRQLFQRRCSPAVLGAQFATLIQSAVNRKEAGSVEMCERRHT
jgi:glycosyltransferase involved in cell wall biosynthesis